MTKSETKARRDRNKLTKESHVLRGVLDLLTAENIPHYRLNSGSVIMDGRRVRLCPKGTPDVLALVPSIVPSSPPSPVFFETKRPGGRITCAQEREHERLRSIEALVMVVEDVSQVVDFLRHQRGGF